MTSEPEKTSHGAAPSQDTPLVPDTATATARSPTSISPTTTVPAPEPEPGQTPKTDIFKEETTAVPPPPQPQAFPNPYSSTSPGHGATHTQPGANKYQPPAPAPSHAQAPTIPPPPKAAEMHIRRTSIISSTTTTAGNNHPHTHLHRQPYTPSHSHRPDELTHLNLEHPPGYRQNPAIAQPSPATLASDGAGGGGPHFGMRQVWDPAPGEAGGRYVYDYIGGDFFDEQEEDDGYGNVRRGGGEEDWGWDSAVGAWEATVSWMKSAGEKMAEAEEGVWRWVNGRS
ncbi:hypothetical protein FQN49_007506 [Arthroderma sp. PD_2]|nr:hypothetical protein FQN49_007506 [Arthroderma sp. PD_2]